MRTTAKAMKFLSCMGDLMPLFLRNEIGPTDAENADADDGRAECFCGALLLLDPSQHLA